MTIRSMLLRLVALGSLFIFTSLINAAPQVMHNDALPKNIISSKPWYSFKQLSQGGKIFRDNCAVCHGKSAQGAPKWQQKDASGRNPPPPLNGTAHSWHHRINELFDTVKYGTINNGGGMPAWQTKLTDDEIVSVIAWFQSRWPKRVYQNWIDRPHH